MPRPRSLTSTGIATAALTVIDRDGLGALSMRAVAGELGMGTMSLYRYVADREQLESLVVELVLEPLDLELPAGASWREHVMLLAERLRDAVRAHPATVSMLLSHRHTSHATLRWIEVMLGVLHRTGFAGKQRVIAQRTVVNHVLGGLQAEHYSALSGAGTTAMAELPPDEYPWLSDTGRHARHVTADEEFRVGLDAVLHGLAASLVTPSG